MLNDTTSLLHGMTIPQLSMEESHANQNARRKDLLLGGFLVAVGVCLGFIGSWAIVRTCQTGCCNQYSKNDGDSFGNRLPEQSPEINTRSLPIFHGDHIPYLPRQYAAIDIDTQDNHRRQGHAPLLQARRRFRNGMMRQTPTNLATLFAENSNDGRNELDLGSDGEESIHTHSPTPS
jgi:hypothetical protein